MFVILLRINLSFMNKLYDIIPGCHLKIESVIKSVIKGSYSVFVCINWFFQHNPAHRLITVRSGQ